MNTIAYLAPELTALSATFIYEELGDVEKAGFSVIPVSVHRTTNPARALQALEQRTRFLYCKPTLNDLRSSVRGMTHMLLHGRTALRWVFSDIINNEVSLTQRLKLLYQFLVASKLAGILVENRCSHLHVHFAHVPTQLGMYAAAMADTPFTVMAHANDIFERGSLLREKVERAKMVFTISEYNRNHLLRKGADRKKITLLRCYPQLKSGMFRLDYSASPPYRLGTLGRLVEKKGIAYTLHAVSLLKAEGFDLHLSVAGDGPLRGALEQLSQSLGLSSNVEFIGDIDHAQVGEWLMHLDVFALACCKDQNGDMDGIPVALMEAMKTGVPVVSTNLSGIPELVIQESTGLLAQPADPADLARQIASLLSSENLRASLGRAGRQHVLQEFSQEKNIAKLVQFFKKAKA
jgi:glycosyltransferase involved in cell wall biosynthesis